MDGRLKGIKKLVLVWGIIVFLLAVSVGLIPEDCVAGEAELQSQCIVCHTDVKKLIRLGWEIEKIRPKPVKSAETSGEG